AAASMEQEFIQRLRERLPQSNLVRVGIGDDAAVIRDVGEHVVTTDMLMEGVDFELEKVDLRRVGRKALAVNLSDLAAMATEPYAAVVAVALPRAQGLVTGEALYDGLLPLAHQFDVAIAGGDTNSWDGPLVICITAFGRVTPRGALLRSGARPGDDILVTGEFGGSLLGRQFDFLPRIAEALWLHRGYELHAGIDVSDGLSLDLARLAEASGCGAELHLDRIPISVAARQLAEQSRSLSPLEHALGDGEDFELILAVPPAETARLLSSELPVPLTRIGQFVPQSGLWQVLPDGSRVPLTPRGYQHALT
ncbi:MAG: thiamine-monophosphate kinase, partial [Pirellulaceae bacterium]